MILEWLKNQNVNDFWIKKHKINRIYIGSEFCFQLFPDKRLLEDCLNKSIIENLEITIVLPFIREDQTLTLYDLLNFLDIWSTENKKIELVVNDWGTLHYINSNYSNFTLSFGRLLNKTTKDTKTQFKWGTKKLKEKLKYNQISDSKFVNYLNRLGIQRFEYDFFYALPSSLQNVSSFHFPFFQTNTSLYCPLYSDCVNHNRANQQPINNCPQYCSEFVYLYPKHLNMIGEGTSLFGFDNRALYSTAFLESLYSNEFRRLVYHFN